jgi:hypothetical protein
MKVRAALQSLFALVLYAALVQASHAQEEQTSRMRAALASLHGNAPA